MKAKDEVLVSFFVPGIPATAGSKRPHMNKATGKAYVSDDCKKGPAWRTSVETAAAAAYHGDILRGPLDLAIVFYQLRPLSHYGTGKNAGKLRPNCPRYPAKRPDATKLLRCTEDALKGLLWADDGQIVITRATKLYGDRAGALVQVTRPPELTLRQLVAKVMEDCFAHAEKG